MKRARSVIGLLAVATVMTALLAWGCGGGEEENGAPVVSDTGRAEVGLAGATVSLEGGPEIEIPTGAIAADSKAISVTIKKSTQEPSLPEGLKMVGEVYEIGPEGATFLTAVRITLPIPEGEDPGDIVGVVTLDPDSGEWVSVSSAVDTEARTVSAFTTHLSPFPSPPTSPLSGS